MIFSTLRRQLSAGIFGLGILGLILRKLMLSAAVDEKGLIIPGHPLIWALALVSLLALAVALLAEAGKRHTLPEAVGLLAAAAGLALAGSTIRLSASAPLDGVHLGLCLVSAVCLAAAGIRRFTGKEGHLLCYAPVCLFFAVHMVCRYRVWSAEPQAIRYLHEIFCVLALMVFAYLRCVPGRLRLRRFAALAGAFCCMTVAELLQQGFGPMYLGCAFWLLTEQNLPGDCP